MFYQTLVKETCICILTNRVISDLNHSDQTFESITQ